MNQVFWNVGWIGIFSCQLAIAAYPEQCAQFTHRGKTAQAQTCFSALIRHSDPYAQAEGNWGLGNFDEANKGFRAAYRMQPDSTKVRVEWGKLFLDRFNPQEASKLFEEALKLDPKNSTAYIGLARVNAENFDKKAVAYVQQAIATDPKSAEAHALLAYLLLEDSNVSGAATEAQKALGLSNEDLDSMAVLASIDLLKGSKDSPWFQNALKVNPVYGEAYETAGHFLEINRRYDDAIQSYRKALDLNGSLWRARSELGVNLMRLGLNDEAKQQLTKCYEARYRNAETVNSLRLLDTLKDYKTFPTPASVVVLHEKESELLRPYVEPELKRAMETYERKYKLNLQGPVRLEMYPNHDDFVVRTLGLPGQGGLLGVTFNRVVAMDSPSARPAGDLNWGSTLWHELNHVYVVSATNALVPRWFAEGLAVHEESATSSDWGDRMTPSIITALRDKKMLAVVDLDRGFVRPAYPNQVVVSYFQAGKICDYIAARWGYGAIQGMIASFAARKTTAEAIADNLHQAPGDFDKAFLLWLDQQTGPTVKRFEEWKKQMTAAQAQMKNGKIDHAIRIASSVRDFYREYIGDGSAYELLADAYMSKGDKAAAIKQLEAYRQAGGTNVTSLKKLAVLEQESNQPQQAEATLRKLNYLIPQDEDIHHRLGDLLMTRKDAAGAIREYEAVVHLQPADMAESHYRLADALTQDHRLLEAKDQVLIALEAAPNFKPAQRLLLELIK